MARRIIIGEIVNLIKGIGGNPNKFIGTKSNINFLGKGPKESLFQAQIDIEGLMRSEFPIERVVTEAERAGGYAHAGKLNNIQLQRLKDNLIKLKEAYFPPVVANITDLGTGTRGLTQEGLGSLREGQRKFPPTAEGIGKGDPTKAGTYQFLDPTTEKVSYASKFNPNNEVHVNKAKALLEDPQLKGVYTEAEVKNAYDFEGLYQSHFDKGHVDVAVLLEQAGHNIPQMRASARSALLDLMKKESIDGVPFAEIDLKYITEGGGGRAGDPINLMVKYFGKNAAESLPKEATKENITRFTDFIMAAKDRRGRGIRDPFFDRESIEFTELASGGRVGFKWGSGLSKALLRRINKKVVKNAVDDIFPTGDYKMDAELAAEALVENNPRLFGNKLIDDLDDAARLDIYGLVLGEVQTRFGLQVRKNMGIKSLIKGVDEKFGEGTLKRASDLPKGTKYAELEAVKDFEARNRTFKLNIDKFMQQFGVSREEATRISLLPAEEQKIAIQRYIDQDFAQQNQLFDYSPKKFDAASGGLAKILEV